LIRFAFFVVLSLLSVAAEGDEPRRATLAQDLNAELDVLRRNRVPTPRELKAIRYVTSTVAQWIGQKIPGWTEPLLGRALTQPEGARLVDALREAPVFVCSAELGCAGCRNPLGCIQVQNKVGASTGVLRFHPCLFSNHAKACRKVAPNELQANVRLLFEVVQEAAASLVLVREASGAMNRSLATAWDLLARCPGPLPASGRAFLERGGLLTELNSFWQACGDGYMSLLRRASATPACLAHFNPQKIRQAVGLGGPIPVRRCDAFCEMITCGNPENATPRMLLLGDKPILSLPPGACEGAAPLQRAQWIQWALGQYGKSVPLAARTTASELCLQALKAGGEVQPNQGVRQEEQLLELPLIE
jgi:hypothetical protein